MCARDFSLFLMHYTYTHEETYPLKPRLLLPGELVFAVTHPSPPMISEKQNVSKKLVWIGYIAARKVLLLFLQSRVYDCCACGYYKCRYIYIMRFVWI